MDGEREKRRRRRDKGDKDEFKVSNPRRSSCAVAPPSRGRSNSHTNVHERTHEGGELHVLRAGRGVKGNRSENYGGGPSAAAGGGAAANHSKRRSPEPS